MKYFAPEVDFTKAGPQMSLWTSYKGLDAQKSESWVGSLWLLASWQAEQTVDLYFPKETLQLFMILDTMSKAAWPSL